MGGYSPRADLLGARAGDSVLLYTDGVSEAYDDRGLAYPLAERAAAGCDWLEVQITEAPPRFLAGQESALVNRLGGGPARPTSCPSPAPRKK